VWHLLDALKRFDSLDLQRVMEITFEVARLGESGLDYANPEKKYTLSAYPGESFSASRVFQQDYGSGNGAAGEVVEINSGNILALALCEKALG
jgi:hypothetical protein